MIILHLCQERPPAFAGQADPGLVDAAQAGDKLAARTFILKNANLGPALLMGGTFSTFFRGVATHEQAHDDIAQLAVLGLYHALQGWDANKGAFSTYAESHLYALVKRAFQGGLHVTSDWAQNYGPLVRVPEHRKGFHQINAHLQSRKVAHWGEFTREMLQAETDFSDQAIAQYFEDRKLTVPLGGSAEAEAIAEPQAEDALSAVESKLLWEDIQPWLTSREEYVLYACHVDGISEVATAEKLGVSRALPGQIRQRAIQHLLANPAIVHAYDLPLMSRPEFPYAKKWRAGRPCPVDRFPSPAEVRNRNGEIYEQHQPLVAGKKIFWLPAALQEAAIDRYTASLRSIKS